MNEAVCSCKDGKISSVNSQGSTIMSVSKKFKRCDIQIFTDYYCKMKFHGKALEEKIV